MNLVHLRIYQSRRVYLDEYPDQKKLRKTWLKEFHKKEQFIQNIQDILTHMILAFRSLPKVGDLHIFSSPEEDVHFYNRWIKRN